MNKRKRAILDSLSPVVNFVQENRPAPERPWRDVAGLSMTARPEAGGVGEVILYGRIGGGGWLMDGIGANDVAAALRELGPGPLNVRINSGGGDVFDGVAIHSLLARHPGTVTVYVDGVAASAASFIMLAGDRVVSSRNAMVMIHDAMTGTWGNRAAHERAMGLLDKVSDNIADMYAEKAGEDVEFWRGRMLENGEDGVWYTGQEALAAGLVDELVEPDEDDADKVDDYLQGWVNILPKEIAARVQNSTKEAARDEPPAVEWDRAAFANLMKEVFA